MTRTLRVRAAAAVIGLFLALTAGRAFATEYVVTNNDVSASNTISIYKLSGPTLGATLVGVTTVSTKGAGIGSGYAANRSVVANEVGFGGCVYAGDAGSGDISAMESLHGAPLHVVQNYRTQFNDAATAGGLGLIITSQGTVQYLVSNYTGNDSNVPPAIGVWSFGGNCTLGLQSHLPTAGINGGPIDSMALSPNGAVLVVAYTDGSVGSYIINGNGVVHLVSQEMIAGSGVGSGAYAASVTVSHDGKWAIFGDSSASNTTQVDVASIGSNGALGPTTTYGGDGSLGSGLDTAGIEVSPDDRFIYAVNSGSGQLTTLSFDTTTGVVTYPNNCLTNLKDYNSEWSTASQVDVIGLLGAGTGLYVSEGFLTGDSYIALLSINSKTGCTTELPHSPFTDPNGGSLQSIAAFTF